MVAPAHRESKQGLVPIVGWEMPGNPPDKGLFWGLTGKGEFIESGPANRLHPVFVWHTNGSKHNPNDAVNHAC